MKYSSYEIGPSVRRMRKERRMTLEELSEKTGLSESTLNKIEIGNRNMSMQTLFALMNAFESDANSILLPNYQMDSSIEGELKLLPQKLRKPTREAFSKLIEFVRTVEESK